MRILTGFSMLLFALPLVQAQKVAAALAGVPLRLSVRPNTSTPAVNQRLKLVVTLVDGEGKPANAKATVKCDVFVRTPSGRLEPLEETLNPGVSYDTQDYVPKAVGRYSVEVVDKAKRLQSGAITFYVFPRTAHSNFGLPPKWWMETDQPRWLAAKPPPQLNQIVARPPKKAKLSVGYSAGSTERADAVTIGVDYDDGKGGGAPEDIRVWFSPSVGAIDKKPLVIRKGERQATAVWTSDYPVRGATIKYENPKERFEVELPEGNRFNFIPRVVRLEAVVPPAISILDKPVMTIRFLDGRGFSVRSDSDREVTLTVMQSGVTVSPTKQSVPDLGGSIQATVSPTSLGTAKLKIDATDLNSEAITVTIDVGIGSLIYLSLLGGLAGGALAFVKDRKNLPLKILGGVAGGFVLAAIYVFGVVPISGAVLPANAVAAVAISLVGGWAGFAVIDWTWAKLSKA